MKKCKTCNINFNTDRFTCPFCKKNLEEINKDESYQSYPKFKDKIYKVNWVQKTFLFLTIITCIIIGLTNYYEYKKGIKSLWSIIALIGIITIWALIKGLIISRKNAAKRIFNFGASLTILMLSIEYLSITNLGNYSNWSINYVIPFILLATLTAINLLIVCNKKNFSNYIGYCFWISILLITYHLLYVFNVTSVLWTSTMCFAYGITTIIALFFFGGKATIQELRKRLTL